MENNNNLENDLKDFVLLRQKVIGEEKKKRMDIVAKKYFYINAPDCSYARSYYVRYLKLR